MRAQFFYFYKTYQNRGNAVTGNAFIEVNFRRTLQNCH